GLAHVVVRDDQELGGELGALFEFDDALRAETAVRLRGSRGETDQRIGNVGQVGRAGLAVVGAALTHVRQERLAVRAIDGGMGNDGSGEQRDGQQKTNRHQEPPACGGFRRYASIVAPNTITTTHQAAMSPLRWYQVTPPKGRTSPSTTAGTSSALSPTIRPHGSTIAEIPVVVARM